MYTISNLPTRSTNKHYLRFVQHTISVSCLHDQPTNTTRGLYNILYHSNVAQHTVLWYVCTTYSTVVQHTVLLYNIHVYTVLLYNIQYCCTTYMYIQYCCTTYSTVVYTYGTVIQHTVLLYTCAWYNLPTCSITMHLHVLHTHHSC